MNAAAYQGLSERELWELAEKHGFGMDVIAVASLASGSGKSTLAAHLAIQAERKGLGPVVLVDTVPRGSLTQWWDKRKSPKPPMSSMRGAKRIDETLRRLREMGAKMCIIDTAPVMDDIVEQVIAVSGLVIVPCRPDPKHLLAADATSEVALMLGKKSIFVVNAAIRQARMTGAITVELAKHGTVAPVTVHSRPAFRDATAKGLTVMELEGAEEAAAEVEQLWDYLAGRLPKDFTRTM